jgi:hypothetical protein
MVLNATSLLCPFITTSNIFTLKDTAKQHCNNVGLNVLDNASLAVYQAALAGQQLTMGLNTNNSPIDARLSKIEVAIKNITSLMAVGNLVVNRLMEHDAATVVTAKVMFAEE